MTPLFVARAHGIFNIGSGVWPLLHLPSFERFFGPVPGRREQDWLVKTVAGLLIVNGWSQTCARPTPESLAQARRTGVGTALALLVSDLVYVPAGRARSGHAVDAVVEAVVLAAWWWCGRPPRDRRAL